MHIVKNNKIKIILLLIILWTPGSLRAQSGIGLGFGEAYSTFARGSEAIFWNPANLGFRNEGLPSFTVSLYSIRVNIGQNSINLDLFNEFFTEKDKVLSRADVDRMLNKIPDDGLYTRRYSDIYVSAYNNFSEKGTNYEGLRMFFPKNIS